MTESSLNKICTPALIYICFSMIQIFIDVYKQMYNTAFIKFWVMIVFTILLNILCSRGLGIISWFIVFIPFIFMTLIITILLFMFGLDPMTGKLRVKDDIDINKREIVDYRQMYAIQNPNVVVQHQGSISTDKKSCDCSSKRTAKVNKKSSTTKNVDQQISDSINDINNIVNKINDSNNLNN